MSEPVVSVCKLNNRAKVRIEFDDGNSQFFTLTDEGCVEAGRALFKSGHAYWLCASSVDFPHEVDKDFRMDIRQLLDEGYADASKDFDTHRKSLLVKILAECDQPDFQASLTTKEKISYKELKAEASELT